MLLLANWNVHHAQRKFSCDIQDIFFIGEHKCYDLQKDVSCIIFMYMADCLHPIHVAPSCWAMTHCIAESSMSKFSSLLFICYRANAWSTRHKPPDSFASLVCCTSPYFRNGGQRVWFCSLLMWAVRFHLLCRHLIGCRKVHSLTAFRVQLLSTF